MKRIEGAGKQTYKRKPAGVGFLQHLCSEQPEAPLEIDENQRRVHNVEEVEHGEGQDGQQLLA